MNPLPIVSGSVAVETVAPDARRPRNVSGSVYKAHAKLRLGKLTKPSEQFGILSSMGTAGLLGMLAQYDAMRAECYEPLGWDERGMPYPAAIEESGLQEVLAAPEFERMAGIAATANGTGRTEVHA